MCVLIDTNLLCSVLLKHSKKHEIYEPIYNWLFKKAHGRFVYGGTTYKSELQKVSSIVPVIAELNRMGRLVEIDDSEVDAYEEQVNKYIDDNGLDREKFDDPHLPAIINLSKCKIVCTDDSGARELLKISELYVHRNRVPKFYSKKSHASLIRDRNISDKCRD